MSAQSIAFRYAKSLLELSSEANQLGEVYSDVTGLIESVNASRELEMLLQNPVVKPSKKRVILSKLLDGKVSPITKQFVDVVIRKGRENLLPNILNSFVEQWEEKQGITKVKVTTALPLEAATSQAIEARIREIPGVRSQIQIEQIIDPSLIGGFIIDLGDRRIDESISSQIKSIKKQYSNN